MNGIVTKPFAEAPILKNKGNYLMFLQHTSEGYYLILGGYQGICIIISSFNIRKCNKAQNPITQKKQL
jgi:hypothetical protein